MIHTLSLNELLGEIKTRSDIYIEYFSFKLEEENPEAGEMFADQAFDQLSRIAFGLFAEGRYHRYEDVETGFDKKSIMAEGNAENMLMKDGQIISCIEHILQQTETRWEFRHPSFQEFFAARGLAQQKNWEEIVRKYCRNKKWEETLRFFSHFAPVSSDELYDLYLEEGALFLAGNSLSEAQNLSETRRLLVGQLLKYQCKDEFPQFSRNRLIKVSAVLEKVDNDYLKQLLGQLLSREKRDSRILFGVIELILAQRGVDFMEMVDSQDFARALEVEELHDFLDEHKNPDKVDVAIGTSGSGSRRWRGGLECGLRSRLVLGPPSVRSPGPAFRGRRSLGSRRDTASSPRSASTRRAPVAPPPGRRPPPVRR